MFLKNITTKYAIALLMAMGLCAGISQAAMTQKHYYGYDAVLDKNGVIAPWYTAQNGQLDLRVRIAAETLKRYPWTDSKRAVAALPEYMFSSAWKISPDGKITVPAINDWMNGDLGQRSAYVLSGLVDYYAYSGDAAAIAHITWLADFLVDYCQTPDDNPWPRFLVSVPVKGKPYGRVDPKGHIQLDIASEVGLGMLKAYEMTGNTRWFDTVKHWADLLAEKRNRESGSAPWGRYANPEDVSWKDNKQTAGIVFHLYMFDELIRLGYTGKNNSIVEARDAGRAYLRDILLPKWTVNDTFGINYWDWTSGVQLENVTEFAARYMMDNKDDFPNWHNDVRNALSLFFNHTSVDTASNGEVYSGAWAFPESSGCCGRSLWYGSMEIAWPLAQYGVEADSEWGRELARRMQILATYDIHETGYSEDNIDGGTIVNADWFKIAHPMALKHVLATIAWLPEVFGASRENHIVRSSSIVKSVTYRKGDVRYSTFDAPKNSVGVLRLSFIPLSVRGLRLRKDLAANGYTVKSLANGDCIVSIRHDGIKDIVVTGKNDPQVGVHRSMLSYKGGWTELFPLAAFLTTAGGWPGQLETRSSSRTSSRVASKSGDEVSYGFNGNQVRLIGGVDPSGGQAEVYVDGAKQLVGIDCYNPAPRDQQVLYYRNGLADGKHTLKIVLTGEKNPYSKGTNVYIDSLQYSASTGSTTFGEGGGPTGAQRFILGYPGREDYKDSQGNLWRPATEIVVRKGTLADSVASTWWTEKTKDAITGTPDPEIYSYGVHASDFTLNVTTGPGRYHATVKLAAVRGLDTKASPMNIWINGKPVVQGLDIAATAGGANKAVNLVFNNITPRNGIIDIRFAGVKRTYGGCAVLGEVFAQALEVGPGDGGQGASPVTVEAKADTANLLANPGFESGTSGGLGSNGAIGGCYGWTYVFVSPSQTYIWPESDYSIHPDWGLPEIHCGTQALRTHGDKDGHTQVYQDVKAKSGQRYSAGVWAHPVDLRGKGFGTSPSDSAALIIMELDASGQVVEEHPRKELKTAAGYTRLAVDFTASSTTATVRYILDTVITAPYNEGHVTYDDCTLAEAVVSHE